MRFIRYILIILIAITLCGCEKNSLVCSSKKDSAGVSTKQTISIDFKDQKVDKLNFKITITPTDKKIKDYWSLFIETLNEQYSQYDDIDGIEIIKTTNDKKYKHIISISIDPKTIKEEDLNKLGFKDFKNTELKKEDIKKDIENKGFTCN